MANKEWTRTTLGLALTSEMNAKAAGSSGTVPTQVADAVSESFDALWKREPCRFAIRRASLTWGTDKDVLRDDDWNGATITLGGAYTGSKLDCYTFTASGTGTVGAGSITLAVTDYDGDVVATLAIGSNYTPGTAITVANGIAVALAAGGTVAAEAFYVDLKPSLALVPLWNYPGDSTRQFGDFRKLDPEWFEENNNNGAIRFTSDIALFQRYETAWGDQTGFPAMALVEPDQDRRPKTSGNFNWRVRVTPIPSQEVTYTIYYLSYAPTLAATDVPVWPAFMHELWRLDAKWRALQKLGRESSKEAYSQFKAVQSQAKGEENETQENDTPDIQDAYADADAFISSSGDW
jgi:hypothetical protein